MQSVFRLLEPAYRRPLSKMVSRPLGVLAVVLCRSCCAGRAGRQGPLASCLRRWGPKWKSWPTIMAMSRLGSSSSHLILPAGMLGCGNVRPVHRTGDRADTCLPLHHRSFPPRAGQMGRGGCHAAEGIRGVLHGGRRAAELRRTCTATWSTARWTTPEGPSYCATRESSKAAAFEKLPPLCRELSPHGFRDVVDLGLANLVKDARKVGTILDFQETATVRYLVKFKEPKLQRYPHASNH